MPIQIRKFKKSTAKKRDTKKTPARKYPARLQASRVNYTVAKAVSRALDRVSENKILGTTNINEQTGVPIQAGAIAHTRSFCIGGIPGAWSGITGLQSIGGMTFQLGVSRNQRNGHYLYLQKTHITMEIDMNSLPLRNPVEFRCVVFKSRRANNPTGLTSSWGETLFLDSGGNEVGHQTAGINGSDLTMLPLNRKDWSVLKDEKFVMTPGTDTDAANPSVSNSRYGSTRRMMFDLPYYKKVEINPTTSIPDNIDFSYCIAIFARSIGKDSVADTWEVTLRGSTTYKDN